MVIVTQGGDGQLHHNLAQCVVPIAVRHSPPLLLLYTLGVIEVRKSEVPCFLCRSLLLSTTVLNDRHRFFGFMDIKLKYIFILFFLSGVSHISATRRPMS